MTYAPYSYLYVLKGIPLTEYTNLLHYFLI